MLAVDVRDHNIRSTYPIAVQNALDVVDESMVEAIYQGVQEDFWRLMDERAKALGFTAAYSAGRSSGWLAVGGTENWLPETLTNPGSEETLERDNFLLLVFEASAEVGEHIRRFGELVVDAAANTDHCPNCGHVITCYRVGVSDSHDPGCVVGGLLGTMEDRGEFQFDTSAGDNLYSMDVDKLWEEFLGPAVDKIEERFREARS
jgi:hypothetical protein